MSKIREYLNTFQWDKVSGKVRIIAFHLLSILYSFFLFGLTVSLYLEDPEKYFLFRNLIVDIIISLVSGYLFIFLCDITAGVGREGPLFKNNNNKTK